ncbi:hypothetical protein SELMODRAFT_164705 [Selaginella moellendorffii]|uniref:Ubiquitin-like domain-containing protein n=1 Tax=Selaginella moellendorffii TaxID=88036 RepID=D8QTS8_SELML|nr:BAG family molecular chaperone regulator 4 [Selaginella moellendorffii]XP_002971185.1 BAG family molecular chaperone regulator 4 [Selaginella moellendorffii]EFJ27783.1 hypothetical protein SELMODRAFT_147725 [Selaginella moellendorffii]EFJ37166.1 hypothetical protein SELMODRAFT_164705 [Selaginella moellendorffii]|eukprot:XP_002961906.1 BAG family molecular chaperone regulator 4 [Selaginella moellendorffii]
MIGSKTENAGDPGDLISWELRPGGMLVQKRQSGEGENGDSTPAGPLIKIRVSHGLQAHEISVPAQASFGELKKLVAVETGLQPHEQRLLFRGKEKDDVEYLHLAGVKDKAKIILVEDPASRERRLEEMRSNEKMERACRAVAEVGSETDKLAEQIPALEAAVQSAHNVPERDLDKLTELMMRQLLKLDAIEADGEAKVQRRIQVKRVQNYVDFLDNLKTKNSIPHPLASRNSVVTTKWETFDSGVGSLTAPPPQGTPNITTDWEKFD